MQSRDLKVSRMCGLLSGTLYFLFVSSAQAIEAQPNLSTNAAIHALADAVFLGCTFSKIQGTSVFSLPPGVDDDLVPADEADRAFTHGLTDAPLMVSKSLGNHLIVWEDNKGCHVVADQLPVQRSLDALARVFRSSPAFVEQPFTPGYNPIGYVFLRKVGSDGLTVRMEGAEPGLPLHAYRFSLINVLVTRSSGAQP